MSEKTETRGRHKKECKCPICAQKRKNSGDWFKSLLEACNNPLFKAVVKERIVFSVSTEVMQNTVIPDEIQVTGSDEPTTGDYYISVIEEINRIMH